jgi:hypothetical protein
LEIISLEKREKKKLEPNVKETNRPDKVYLDIIKEVITVVVWLRKRSCFWSLAISFYIPLRDWNE